MPERKRFFSVDVFPKFGDPALTAILSLWPASHFEYIILERKSTTKEGLLEGHLPGREKQTPTLYGRLADTEGGCSYFA